MLNFCFQDCSQIFDKYSNVWKNVSTISYTYNICMQWSCANMVVAVLADATRCKGHSPLWSMSNHDTIWPGTVLWTFEMAMLLQGMKERWR